MGRKLTQRQLENLVLQEVRTELTGWKKWVTKGGIGIGASMVLAGLGAMITGIGAPVGFGLETFGIAALGVAKAVEEGMTWAIERQLKVNGEKFDEQGIVELIDNAIEKSMEKSSGENFEVDKKQIAIILADMLNEIFNNLPNEVKRSVKFEEVLIKSATGSTTAKKVATKVLTDRGMLLADNDAESFNRASIAAKKAVEGGWLERIKMFFGGEEEPGAAEALAASYYRRGSVMSESALRRAIHESIKDAFSQRDPDFEWQDGFTDRHYSADTMFAKDWDGNLELLRKEILPQLSHGAQVLDKWSSRSRRSGDVQIFVPNPDQEDMEVLWSYGFQEAHRMDISRRYKDQAGKLFVRTASSRDNYGSYMD